MLIIISFLSKYWKPLAVFVALGLAFTYGYHRGKLGAAIKAEHAVTVEVIKRTTDEAKERVRVKVVHDSYKEDKKLNPINDKRDSCVLSNDPLEKDCK